MKKIISMLLAVSMSLSVMCSSFTVTAVDKNNTAAQTESTGQSSSTVNEKIVEKSNECGINSVEVSGNIATVSYRASKDCTVIVGIYEDDGTNGTHMLTFGTASIKAAETTASVTIDNIPQYFYLKAYLVDSENYRPLSTVYNNSNYTYTDHVGPDTPDDSDGTFEDVLFVNSIIEDLLNSDEYDDLTADAKKEKMNDLLELLKVNELINEYEYYDNHGSFDFEYSGGILGKVMLEDFDNNIIGVGAYEDNSINYVKQNTTPASLSDYSREYNGALLPDDRKLKVLLLTTIANDGADWNDIIYGSPYGINTYIKRESDNNVSVKVVEYVTIDELLNINNPTHDYNTYDIICFYIHGELHSFLKNNGWGMLLNDNFEKNEVSKKMHFEKYDDDVKKYKESLGYENIDFCEKHEVYRKYLKDKKVSFVLNKKGIFPFVHVSFFENNSNNWNAKAVILDSCMSFGCTCDKCEDYNEEGGKKFLSAPSVQVVWGYENPVNAVYARNITNTILYALYCNRNVTDAFTIATNAWNENDSEEAPDKDRAATTKMVKNNPGFRFWEIEAITLDNEPNKKVYEIGEEFNLTGGKITLIYNDNSKKSFDLTDPVIADYIKVMGFNSSKAGSSKVAIRFTDDRNKDFTTEIFDVIVNGDLSIAINTMPNKTEYKIGEAFDATGMTIDVTYRDGTKETVYVTNAMVSGFDSSAAGEKELTVTYTDKYGDTADVKFNIKVEKTVCRIEFVDSPSYNLWQDDRVSEGGWWTNTSYKIREYFSDGTNATKSFSLSFNSDGSVNGYYEGTTILSDDGHGGKIKIEDYDINKTGVQEIKATYCRADGTPDPNVEPVFIWRGIHSGKSYATAYTSPPSSGDLGHVGGAMLASFKGYKYSIGEGFRPEIYYINYDVYSYDSEKEEWRFISPDIWERDSEGNVIKLPDGNRKVNSSLLLSNYHYLGGFDSRFPTSSGDRHAYFEYQGYVFAVSYTVTETGAVSVVSKYDYDLEENMQYDDYSDYDDMEYDTPAVTEVSAETETPDNTDENTDETDSTESTETEVTEPVDTETTNTEQQTEETTVIETAKVEEAPVFAIDNNGIFGFGRASAKKSAQFANLHKNDIYNCYVVKSGSADILGKDNLLFVGQTNSDGNGSLSFEYETTTGEDGTIILRPMSDDPTTPDTPNQPTVPDNGGNSSNTNTNTGTVIPVGGTNTVILTVTVENKVTGKTSKAKGQKTGSSATIKLGTENDGYFANVYTTDGEYICSALIENGRAKFTVPDDVKLKITIDSIAYGEDVSSEAGVFGDSTAESLPYAAITVIIAVVGIYLKKRSEKKVK